MHRNHDEAINPVFVVFTATTTIANANAKRNLRRDLEESYHIPGSIMEPVYGWGQNHIQYLCLCQKNSISMTWGNKVKEKMVSRGQYPVGDGVVWLLQTHMHRYWHVLGYLVAKMMMTRAILQWLEAKANPNRGGKLAKKTKPTYKQLRQHLDRLGSFHNFPTVETIMRRLFMVHLTRWEISCWNGWMLTPLLRCMYVQILSHVFSYTNYSIISRLIITNLYLLLIGKHWHFMWPNWTLAILLCCIGRRRCKGICCFSFVQNLWLFLAESKFLYEDA